MYNNTKQIIIESSWDDQQHQWNLSQTGSRPKCLQVSYTFQVIPPGRPWRRRWPPWSLEVEEKHHQDLPWAAAATYHGLHPLEVVWQCHGRTWNNDWSDGVARARFLNQCGAQVETSIAVIFFHWKLGAQAASMELLTREGAALVEEPCGKGCHQLLEFWSHEFIGNHCRIVVTRDFDPALARLRCCHSNWSFQLLTLKHAQVACHGQTKGSTLRRIEAHPGGCARRGSAKGACVLREWNIGGTTIRDPLGPYIGRFLILLGCGKDQIGERSPLSSLWADGQDQEASHIFLKIWEERIFPPWIITRLPSLWN